ncbi:MAG: hypothetical protein Q7U68_07605, partial [Candidatus Roizmanbacteria bacterium]|nr:hypothetical protein [Candidatus Roizmanbacteria bacterium]
KRDVFSLNEGETVWFVKNKAYLGERIETKNIYVDAYGIGDVGSIVLRDRKTIATDGIVFVLSIIDNQGLLLGQPKIVSRGFVFEKEENRLYLEARKIVENVFKPKSGKVLELGNMKREVIENLEEFFRKATGRKPLIVAEVIQF